GLAERDRLLQKAGMQPEQTLILTKALGTGALFAADMQRRAKGRWIDQAVESMLQSNQAAAQCLMQHQASACTDITGFGLLGHLYEMVQASQVAVELNLEAIPLLPGASTVVAQGIVSSLQPQNLRAALKVQNWSQISDRPEAALLFDPQTSGGLLAAIPAERASDCVSALQALGYRQSRAIAQVVPAHPTLEPITIVG
ncbi:MAG TPA: selenide, water dikinase SelD, partial [Candidatus Obscuribacterales bacterium]